MSKITGIPIFQEIKELHHAINSPIKAKSSLFDIFRAEELLPTVRNSMPAYRKNFHLITLVLKADNYRETINVTKMNHFDSELFFSAQGQVVSWEREGNWYGYTLMFKPEFLEIGELNINFLKDFPFFEIDANISLNLSVEQKQWFIILLEKMLTENGSLIVNSPDIIRACLKILLYECKRIYSAQNEESLPSKNADKATIITREYKILAEKHFADRKPLPFYAEKLNISINYLNKCTNSALQKTPSEILNDLILLEIKNLLWHSNLSLKEIAYYLNFQDTAHFNHFFKKQTKTTPLIFRQSK